MAPSGRAGRRPGMLQSISARSAMISGSPGTDQEQPRQPYGFVAQRHAHLLVTAARRITLVEDQIQHGGNRGEPFGPFDCARRLEGNLGFGHARFGAGNTLFHGAFADQKRAGDLLYRKPGHHPQRQRDLLHRWQIGMAADEQEPQHVIAIMRTVEPLGDIAFSVAEIGNPIIGRQRRALVASARLVETDIAPDQHQPRDRIARRSVDGPVLECAQTCFLEQFSAWSSDRK